MNDNEWGLIPPTLPPGFKIFEYHCFNNFAIFVEILILQSYYNIMKFAMKRVIAEVLSNRVIESSCNNMLSGENFSNSPIQNPRE